MSMKTVDQRIYRTFEEFEREELRRVERTGSVDEMIDTLFGGELDFEESSHGRRRSPWDDEDEE